LKYKGSLLAHWFPDSFARFLIRPRENPDQAHQALSGLINKLSTLSGDLIRADKLSAPYPSRVPPASCR
jgi:hypothetical protein